MKYRPPNVFAPWGNRFKPFSPPQPVSVTLNPETRFAGHWVIAPPGRGKTTLLHALFLEDAQTSASIILMDSKGDLINPIRNLAGISDRLIIIEPDPDYPLALNPLDIPRSNIAKTVDLLEYLFSALLEAKLTALQKSLFRNLLPAIVQCVPNPTLGIFRDIIERGLEPYRQYFDKLPPLTRRFFDNQFDSKTYTDTRSQLIWRLDLIMANELTNAIFNSPKTKFDIGKEMDAGKIIIINNSKDLLGEEGAEFFGRFFIALVLAAAQQRQGRPRDKKRPCFFYIDEAHNVISRDERIATIMDECRSQNIGLILAHQRLAQIKSPDVLSALQNCAVRMANSDDDAKALAPSLRTTTEHLQALQVGEFALWMRGLPNSVTFDVPYYDLSEFPTLSPEQQRALRDKMRAEYCNHEEPEPTKPEPVAPTPRPKDEDEKLW